MKYAVLLLALMFAGVTTPSMAQKPKPKGQAPQKLTFECHGETIEVAKKDFPRDMSWNDAMASCENLGNGWRLPSINELKAMYEQLHTKGKGNFRTYDWYWSSSENNLRPAYHAWLFNFDDGRAYNGDLYYKSNSNHVRAVRTLP